MPLASDHLDPLRGIRTPYPGLRPFTRDEAQIFFGRDEQIDGLLERLDSSRFVAITGESGCGKSSLVRAGLLPALSAGFLYRAGSRWLVADFRPGSQPMQNLAASLGAALLGDQATAQDEAFLAARLRRGPRGIVELFKDLSIPEGTEVLILVDQFEEILRFRNRPGQHEADAFVALLLETISPKNDIPVRIVLTLRTDHLGGCAMFRGLPEALNRCQYLTPRLERAQLLEAIVGPACVFDGDVDKVLANHLVNEVKQGRDQLPVLEHALLWMWTRAQTRELRRSGPQEHPSIVLTMADYTELGSGLGEAMSKHADAVYASLDEPSRRIAVRLFCALWDEESTGGDSRRACTLREAARIVNASEARVRAVADVFRQAEHSFLMPPEDRPLQPETVLDVSHESLFRHWGRLSEWIREEADHAEKYRRWSGLARDWIAGRGNLLVEKNLEAAESWHATACPNEGWAQRHGSDADELAVTERFLHESREAHAMQERKRKRARNWLIALATVGGLILWIGSGTVTAYLTRMQETEKLAAESEELARQHQLSVAAAHAVQSAPVRSIQLALEAQGSATVPEVEAALRKALRASRFRSLIVASSGSFRDARFLEDGRRAVTIGDGDGLALWDIETGRRLRAFHAELRPRRLALDGRIAATVGEGGHVHVWDLEDQKLIRTLGLQLAPVTALAVSSRGSLLAIASEDGKVGLWDLKTGDPKRQLGDLLIAGQLAFTRDGARLATASDEGRITLWDVREGRKLGDLDRDVKSSALAFDADSRFLAVSNRSGVLLWDPIIHRLEGALPHASLVHAIAFSPDGDRLATVGRDGTLRLWDARVRKELFHVSDEPALRGAAPGAPSPDGTASELRTVSFSADGRQVVTTALDGTAKFWSVDNGGELESFRAHKSRIHQVEYHASRRLLATASDDGTAAVWTDDSRRLFCTKKAEAPRAITFNSAGTHLLVSDGGKLLFLDLDREGTPTAELSIGAEPILDLKAFLVGTQERVVIATARRVEVWSVTERERLFPILQGTLDRIGAVAVSADGRRIAAECSLDESGVRQLCLWDAMNGERLGVLGHHSPRSPGGVAPAHDLPVLDLQFSPDHKWLLSSSEDKTVKVWNIAELRFEAVLGEHRESVSGVAISPDGKTIASGGADWLKLWNGRQRTPLHGFPDVETGVGGLAFRPDGDALIVGGVDGVVRIHSMDASVLGARARRIAPYALDDEECLRYSGARRCRERPTRAQHVNLTRYRARPEESAPDRAPAGGVDGGRFEGARQLQHVARLAGQVLGDVRTKLTRRLGGGPTREQMEQAVAGDLVLAIRQIRERGGAHLELARTIDPGLDLEPDGFLSKVIAAELLAMCRGLFEHAELVPLILRAVPGFDRSPDEIQRSARLLTTSAVIALAGKELDNKHPEEALDRLKTVQPPPGPQLVAWVRLVVRANKELGVRRLSEGRLLEAKAVFEGAVQLATAVGLALDDADAIVDIVDVIILANDLPRAAQLLTRALVLDPDNNEALLKLGRLQADVGEHVGAIRTLRRVSPVAPGYRKASAKAGALAFRKLGNPTEAYRLMLLGLEGSDAGHWAEVAETAWAAGRWSDARLIAQRVLQAQEESHSQPHVELAMRFVVVASLTQSGDLEEAERELGELLQVIPKVEGESWSYEGSRSAAKKIASQAERRFLLKLLDHVGSPGKRGDPEVLRQLLSQVGGPAKP